MVKRWKPCLATELDRFLEGAVRDRALLCELLDVDDLVEMPTVMDDYRIPLPAHFTPFAGPGPAPEIVLVKRDIEPEKIVHSGDWE